MSPIRPFTRSPFRATAITAASYRARNPNSRMDLLRPGNEFDTTASIIDRPREFAEVFFSPSGFKPGVERNATICSTAPAKTSVSLPRSL